MDIGLKILRRRKERNMTQKQLAEAVGISAAAVSKWETGEANPDIALLAPIARFLHTTTDDLLDTRVPLCEEQINEITLSIQDTFRKEGHRAGMDACRKAVCTHPDNPYLRLKLAGMVTAHMMYLDGAERTEENHLEYIRYGLKLLQPVLKQRDSRYWIQANTIAASYEMMLGNYVTAEACLKEIPKMEVDVNILYSTLYLYEEEWAKARACALQNIAGYGRIVMQSLGTVMASYQREQNMSALQETALLYSRMESDLGYMDGLGHYHCIEIYLAQGQLQAAETELLTLSEALEQFIRSMAEHNNGELLNQNIQYQKVLLIRLVENHIQILEEDAQYARLKETASYSQVLQKLRSLAAYIQTV